MAYDNETGRFHLKHRGKNQNIENYESLMRARRHRKKEYHQMGRNYLKSPDDWYKYHADTSLGYYNRHGSYTRALKLPYLDRYSQNWLYDSLYPERHNRNRKALIIGERPSLWKGGRLERPELPGNLFLDNLRHKNIDWSAFENVTWNQVLDSHRKDVDRNRTNILTLPQKEAWLSSIDSRYDIHRQYRGHSLPQISPRLFKPKSMPKPPQPIGYKARDGMGALYYLEGSSDPTNKEYRKLVFPEITKRAKTPKRLNF